METECPSDDPTNLRHLQTVGQPRAEMVAVRGNKHLGLVFQAAERGGVDDPVPVPLKGIPAAAARLCKAPPA